MLDNGLEISRAACQPNPHHERGDSHVQEFIRRPRRFFRLPCLADDRLRGAPACPSVLSPPVASTATSPATDLPGAAPAPGIAAQATTAYPAAASSTCSARSAKAPAENARGAKTAAAKGRTCQSQADRERRSTDAPDPRKVPGQANG